MVAGLLLWLSVQLAMCPRSRGFPAGHPCADPALASKPFCDESLTTAQRAAAMSDSLAAMQVELPREDMPLTPPGLALLAGKNAVSNSQQEDQQRQSDTASWGTQATPTDPGLERLELTAGFGLGCLSACCAVLLTAIRAAWRDGALGQREFQPGNNVAKDASVSSDIDDASTSELMASLDEIIAASGSYMEGSQSGDGDIHDGPSSGRNAARASKGSKVRKGKSGTRSKKNGRSRGSGGTPGDRTETAELKEVRSLLESLARSEELNS